MYGALTLLPIKGNGLAACFTYHERQLFPQHASTYIVVVAHLHKVIPPPQSCIDIEKKKVRLCAGSQSNRNEKAMGWEQEIKPWNRIISGRKQESCSFSGQWMGPDWSSPAMMFYVGGSRSCLPVIHGPLTGGIGQSVCLIFLLCMPRATVKKQTVIS